LYLTDPIDSSKSALSPAKIPRWSAEFAMAMIFARKMECHGREVVSGRGLEPPALRFEEESEPEEPPTLAL
jgi:hypothetical protein